MTAVVDGNASVGSGGSGIGIIDNPNSRSRRMIQPPKTAGSSGAPAGAGGGLRPPIGQGNQNYNQIQELH